MANTGYRQAYIAYKVDAVTGEPLDVDGNLTAESGKLQAILLLVGYTNPDPALYEVQGYFSAKQELNGGPTYIFDPENCPIGRIFVSPNRFILPLSGEQDFVLYSSENWELVAPAEYVEISQTSGGSGYSYLKITGLGEQGQEYVYFRNVSTGETARLYVVVTDNPDEWILTTGFWNNSAFWKNTGIWNY